MERIYGRRRYLGEKKNLKNAEELIEEFKQEEVVVRRQVEEEEEYKRMELPGKFTAKVLYR